MKDIAVNVVGRDPGIMAMFHKQDGYKVVDTIDGADLLCFIGGADVDPKLYNEPALKESYVSPLSDARDEAVWQMNAARGGKALPMVGICRGGQFLNVMNGGSMWQDVDNHGRDHELIDLLITKTPVVVTSTHHQMMIPADDGEEIAIAYRAKHFLSGIPRRKPRHDTEAVWYEKTRSLCFQPHPEYNNLACRQLFFDYIDHLIL